MNAFEALAAMAPIVKPKDPKLRTFQQTWLLQWVHLCFRAGQVYDHLEQEKAWTLAPYPGTYVGRQVTINIDSHETAFMSLFDDDEVVVSLVLDKDIYGHHETLLWLHDRDGSLSKADYAKAGPRAVKLHFFTSSREAKLIFDQPGVGPAMAKYWGSKLAGMPKGKESCYARFHSPAAVQELLEYKQATELVSRMGHKQPA